MIAALTGKKKGDISPRVPVVDVFEEERETMLVVELPGVAEAEIGVELNDDMVTVETTGARTYVKDSVLEEAVDGTSLRREYRDGLLSFAASAALSALLASLAASPTVSAALMAFDASFRLESHGWPRRAR